MRSKPAGQRRELRQRSLPEIFDIAFELYRARLGAFLSAIAFSFLGLSAFGLNYLDLGMLHFETWLSVFALGMTPPDDQRLRAAFGREFFFADGAIFWTLASAWTRKAPAAVPCRMACACATSSAVPYAMTRCFPLCTCRS